MAAITAVELDGLELEATSAYSIGAATAYALEASIPYAQIVVKMQDRPDHWVRSQIAALSIPLAVFMHGDYDVREASYEALKAKFGPGLHTLRWTKGSTEYELQVSAGVLLGSSWLARAAGELTAHNPVAVEV